MRNSSRIVWLILMLALSAAQLSATIYARVEGVVIDKDTKLPLAGVDVALSLGHIKPYKTKTDEKGFFQFSKVEPNRNYVPDCYKKGYVRNAPDHLLVNIALHEKDYGFYKEQTNAFFIKSGEVKQLKIVLEQGGQIAGNVFIKDADGTKKLNDVRICLMKEYEPNDIFEKIEPFDSYYIDAKDAEKGSFTFDGLISSKKYIVRFDLQGFAHQNIRDISVSKNNTALCSYTFDALDKTGIRGLVKVNNAQPQWFEVGVYPENGHDLLASYSGRTESEFIIRMFHPGKYRVEVLTLDSDNEIQSIIAIEKNKLTTVNFDF